MLQQLLSRTGSLLQRKALKIVLGNKEGEGFEAWQALVNKYEPTSKASVVGKLAEILRTPFDGDLLDALTTFEPFLVRVTSCFRGECHSLCFCCAFCQS